MGILTNTQNLEREKERRRKILVWKTIESYQEDEELKEEKNKEESLMKKDTIISTNVDRPSFLIPQEITPDDCKIENEGIQILNVNIEEKKEEIINNDEEEDDNFIVDLSI